MKRTNGKAEINDFFCTQCGQKGIPIVRRAGHGREAGHLKKLFCLFCNKETNHVECKPFSKYAKEDFNVEFLNNNFDLEGNRKISYKELKQILNKRRDKNE
jgi:Ca2+-binding EF-hand superfamily protein